MPLTIEELEQAWRDANLYSSWSAQRVALAVIDAHGRPMASTEAAGNLQGGCRVHFNREPVVPGTLWRSRG